jgi:S1-C subfamily serine protease
MSPASSSFHKQLSFIDFYSMKTKAEKLNELLDIRAASSGAFIGHGLILTVAHAIEAGESAKILFKDFIFEAEILERFPDIDVMLLRFDPSKFMGGMPCLEFSEKKVVLGQKLFFLGFPLPDSINFNPVFYDSNATRLKIDGFPHLFQFNGEISKGTSGSILVDDRLQVVGVVTKKAEKRDEFDDLPNDWNLAVRAEYILKAIQKYLKPRKSNSPRYTTETIAKRLNQAAVVVLACSP